MYKGLGSMKSVDVMWYLKLLLIDIAEKVIAIKEPRFCIPMYDIWMYVLYICFTCCSYSAQNTG